MQRTIAQWLLSSLLLAVPAAAADQPHTVPTVALRTVLPSSGTPLADSIARAAIPLTSSAGSFHFHQEHASETRAWIGRHPALFGALIGAGLGTVASVTMENELFCSGGDDDCFFHGPGRAVVGAGIGAGIGAIVGVLASVGRR